MTVKILPAYDESLSVRPRIGVATKKMPMNVSESVAVRSTQHGNYTISIYWSNGLWYAHVTGSIQRTISTSRTIATLLETLKGILK